MTYTYQFYLDKRIRRIGSFRWKKISQISVASILQTWSFVIKIQLTIRSNLIYGKINTSYQICIVLYSIDNDEQPHGLVMFLFIKIKPHSRSSTVGPMRSLYYSVSNFNMGMSKNRNVSEILHATFSQYYAYNVYLNLTIGTSFVHP